MNIPYGRRPRARMFGVLLGGLLLPAQAHAGMILFHAQGEAGDREIFLAQTTRVADRTPMDEILGDSVVLEMEVHGVHEDASKGDWTVMNLQFRCPAPAPPQWRSRGAAPVSAPAVRQATAWRMGERSYRITRDADQQPLAPTQWQGIGQEAMHKAGVLACNEAMVRAAEKAALTADGTRVDDARLNAGLAPLQLGPVAWTMEYPGYERLRTLAWTVLWKTPRTPGKGDRTLSAQEQAQSLKALEGIGERMAELDAQAEAFARPQIESHHAEQAFLARAAEVRGNRRLNELESSMIMVWQGKPESLVVARIDGAPAVNEAGGLRFLSWSDQADTRSSTVSMASGRVIESHGAFTACEVSFVTARDGQGVWRVADVRVRSQGPAGSMCREMLNTPADALPAQAR